MIDDRVMLFIVILVLTYVFDHKILPQIGLFSISLIELGILMNEVSITSVDSDAYYLFLFVINMIYIMFMILVAPQEDDIEEIM